MHTLLSVKHLIKLAQKQTEHVTLSEHTTTGQRCTLGHFADTERDQVFESLFSLSHTINVSLRVDKIYYLDLFGLSVVVGLTTRTTAS